MLTEARGRIPPHQRDAALGLTTLQLPGDHPIPARGWAQQEQPTVTRTWWGVSQTISSPFQTHQWLVPAIPGLDAWPGGRLALLLWA